jgi:hypothetical protein
MDLVGMLADPGRTHWVVAQHIEHRMGRLVVELHCCLNLRHHADDDTPLHGHLLRQEEGDIGIQIGRGAVVDSLRADRDTTFRRDRSPR